MAGDGDWSSLPADLLDLVSGHLSLERDLLHVRQVCTHWRASFTSRLAAPMRPWVLASRTDPFRLRLLDEYSLWLPRGVRPVVISVPPDLRYCLGTTRGWLVLADDKQQSPTRLVLWEPCTGAEIALPPLPGVAHVFLSGDPDLAASPPEWMAVAVQVTDAFTSKIFFWRPGYGAAWIPAAWAGPHILRVQSVAFHGGKMYYIGSMLGQRITVYDLHSMASSPPVRLEVAHMDHYRAAHLVVCNGNLLLVLLFSYSHPNSPDVYNLGPLGPSVAGRKLVLYQSDMVTDLGGYSLFLGRGDSFALSAEEHPAIRGNCIYYIEHYYMHKKRNWAYVFDLKSGVVEEIPIPPEHMEINPEQRWWPCSWFCPKKTHFVETPLNRILNTGQSV